MQGFLAHEIGAQARQISFGQIGEALKQQIGNHAVEDAVAKKLQPLVVGHAVAAMRQRRAQEVRLGKVMTNLPGEWSHCHVYSAVEPL